MVSLVYYATVLSGECDGGGGRDKKLVCRCIDHPVVIQVAVIYMCTRLMNNLTQAYIPLFLIDTLDLPKVCKMYICTLGL